MRVVPTFLGVAAILGVAATAAAQSAVYRNGVPDGAGGATITDPYRIIDDFSFSSLSTVNGIRFWSLQESAFDLAGFEWTIFTDAAGAPTASTTGGFAQYGQDDPDNPGSPIQYASLDTDLAFELTMTPEPASAVHLATGLFGVFGIARRQRRRA